MELHNADAWLVNTGWMGGKYGVGERIDINPTRTIINSILDGSINNSEFHTLPVFNLSVPKTLEGVESKLLDPREAWTNKEEWHTSAVDLAGMFIKNFHKFTYNDQIKEMMQYGPAL